MLTLKTGTDDPPAAFALKPFPDVVRSNGRMVIAAAMDTHREGNLRRSRKAPRGRIGQILGVIGIGAL
jgi:hypothetical protein